MDREQELGWMLVVEDSRIVLDWLMEAHRLGRCEVPEDICSLATGVLDLLQAVDEAEWEAAEPKPLSDDELRRIVREVTGEDVVDFENL